jgi:hypothetical protein
MNMNWPNGGQLIRGLAWGIATMLKWHGVVVLALVVAGLQAGNASAISVYDNFAAGNTYNAFGGWIVSGPSFSGGAFADAMPFTPSGSYSFVSADVAASLVGGTNSIIITLAANNSGAPGATIESLTVSGEMGAFGVENAPVEADSATHPILDSGVEYWLVLSAAGNTDAVWNYDSTGANGGSQKHDGLAWSFNSGNAAGAFSINGAPLTPVPEPASIALFASGMLAAVGLRAARKRQAGKRSA